MIIFRKAKAGDEDDVAKMFKLGLKRGLFKYTGTSKYTKEKYLKLKKTLKNPPPNHVMIVAYDKAEQRVVGMADFKHSTKGRLKHRADMGWSVHPNYHKQGIGTALLKELVKAAKKKGLKRLEAEIAVKNIGSLKIAEKNGFKIEGRKKRGLVLDNGRYCDTVIVGRLL